MLSRGHALIYAYFDGSNWKNCVEGVYKDVGSSRRLEKVAVAALIMDDFGDGVDEPGKINAQNRSKINVSKTSKTISMVQLDTARS